MSVRKTKGKGSTKSSKSGGIVVGRGGKREWRIPLKARLVLIGTVGVSILALVICSVWGVVVHYTDTSTGKVAANLITESVDQRSIANLTPIQQAEYLANSDEYVNAQQVLMDEIAKTKDPTMLSSLYSEQATISLNAKRYLDAMKYAKLADAAQPSGGSAELIAQIALKTGDMTTARQYLDMAISRVGPTTVNGNLQVRQFKTERQGLGS